MGLMPGEEVEDTTEQQFRGKFPILPLYLSVLAARLLLPGPARHRARTTPSLRSSPPTLSHDCFTSQSATSELKLKQFGVTAQPISCSPT